MGSGPWKFVQWNPQEQLILEANEQYYGTVPSIKKVTIVFMAEDAAFVAVQAGQADVALTAATLADKVVDGYHLVRASSVDNRGFTLPLLPNEGAVTESGYPIGNDVTCNLEIRQAAAYAIGRERIAEVALNGFATPCYSENDKMPWNHPEVGIKTDVAYARKLLADTGWADTDGDGIVEKDGLAAAFNWVIDLMMRIPHMVLIILISFAMGRGLRGLQFLAGLVLMFPHAILHEASVSFLGYGLPPEQPAVGIILAESMTYLSSGMWWMAVFPGMVLVLMVWMIDRLGENLRQMAV